MTMTLVEETLRSQREAWKIISDRVAAIPSHELPHDPPKRVLLFGLGSSHFAARLAGFAILRDRSRPKVPVIACSSMDVGTYVIPQRGDWVFGITHRGTSKPTVDAMNLAAGNGAYTVCVAGENSKPVESAHYTLFTTPQERVEPHTASMTGAICAITSLIIGAKAVEEWDAVRSIGDPDLERLQSKVGMGPSILLGEWEGEWLAKEGALKLMEMARTPVRVYSTEEYFHGPRFASKPEDHIWHVWVPKDPRAPEMKPQYQISITGSTPLAWLPALVELQWLALAVALNRGVNPDDPTK